MINLKGLSEKNGPEISLIR